MHEEGILKKVRNLTIVFGVVYIILGIALISSPQRMNSALGFLLGILAFAVGIYKLVSYFRHQRLESILATDLFSGVALSVLGFICLLYHNQVLSYVTVIFGIFLILGSVIKMQNAINLQKLGYPNWWLALIFGFISLIFSVLIILKPNFISKVFLVLVGVFLLYDGITSLATAIYGEIFLRKLKKGVANVVQAATAVDVNAYEMPQNPPHPYDAPPAPHEPPHMDGGPAPYGEGAPYGDAAPYGEAAPYGDTPPYGATSGNEGMTGIPEPENKEKKKFDFGKITGKIGGFFKKKDVPVDDPASPDSMEAEVHETYGEQPVTPVQDADYHPLDEDPFSSRPTHDASMEGVSFDAAGAAGASAEAPEAPEVPVEETVVDAEAYSYEEPVLTPDEVNDIADEPYVDPLPELKPDPMGPEY